MTQLCVLIADDHPMFRDGVGGLLATTPDLIAVGVASTGEEAVALAAELQPDVILMDIQMPGCGGVEATRRIVAANPGADPDREHVRGQHDHLHGGPRRCPRIHPQRRRPRRSSPSDPSRR
jgi:CheY-like chemotaxis protein